MAHALLSTSPVARAAFHSRPEIYLYHALKSFRITVAPLPVFIRGGADYRRLEPDFVIVLRGLLMVVEVDGEGVATHDQVAFLRFIGCEEMQGYLLSRTVPASNFEQLLYSDKRLSILDAIEPS